MLHLFRTAQIPADLSIFTDQYLYIVTAIFPINFQVHLEKKLFFKILSNSITA